MSGGIAAYKTCTLVSRLVQSGAVVHVAMTKNATEFVSPLTFETLSHNRIVVDTFDRSFVWEVEHVALAKKADCAIVAPATANVIAKLACGIADDFLSTTLLACTCPIIIAPAMNTAMLGNVATKRNLDTLSARGIVSVYGDSGYLACGDMGSGRMAEPETLYNAVCDTVNAKRDLQGKTVLVTSGATRTDIDPVRFLSNRSSGKMGYALACAASKRGASVVYVKGHTVDTALPNDWNTVNVHTTEQMLQAVKDNFARCDIAVMAAAPCDYNVTAQENKIKSDKLAVEFSKAPDIAAWAGKNKGGRKLVVFAAETENFKANALKKLKAKNADMVVLNDVTAKGAGFDVDTNIATLITGSDVTELSLMSKLELANVIWDKILSV